MHLKAGEEIEQFPQIGNTFKRRSYGTSTPAKTDFKNKGLLSSFCHRLNLPLKFLVITITTTTTTFEGMKWNVALDITFCVVFEIFANSLSQRLILRAIIATKQLHALEKRYYFR